MTKPTDSPPWNRTDALNCALVRACGEVLTAAHAADAARLNAPQRDEVATRSVSAFLETIGR